MALSLLVSSCANTSLSNSLERSLAADPALQGNAPLFRNPDTEASTGLQATASLPPDFPSEIPLYPGAALQSVTTQSVPSSEGGSTSAPAVVTRWATTDSVDQIQQFYQQAFQGSTWQMGETTATRLSASQSGLQVVLELPANAAAMAATEGEPTGAIAPSPTPLTTPLTTPTPAAVTRTEFRLIYGRDADLTATNPADREETPAEPNLDSTARAVPQPGDPDFIGPVLPTALASPSPSPTSSPSGPPATVRAFTDVDQAPPELQSYITDLARLGALSTTSGDTLKPNEPITRREFARWLVSANNLIFATQPAKQIRLGTSSETPTFQDVGQTDPDFSIIQGLASAGILPSPLTGNDTVVSFRPEAPLTREDLILWKVPLDIRQALPSVTFDALRETWGFQDSARIDPQAQRAVLADFQLSDLSNIRRAFGYTTLFQPKKPVTRAEAAAVLWHFGIQGDGASAKSATPASEPQG